MPKQVDHEGRRRAIAAAVWYIAATQGLGAVSLRTVAAEAGISMGLVQHYFATKEAMILFAYAYMVELAAEGMRSLVATTSGTQTPRSLIEALCTQGLTFDVEGRIGANAWLVFVAGATSSPPAAAFILQAWEARQALIVGQLRIAQENGFVATVVDPDQEACALLSLVDGFLMQILVGHQTSDDALVTLSRQLDRIFLDHPSEEV